MNTNPLRSYAISLHQDLQQQLSAICQERGLDLIKKLEAAVQACNGSMSELYSLIPRKCFECIEVEVMFFKSIKPLFAAEREYFHRLYHAILFGEEDDLFFLKEVSRMDKLLMGNISFANYYHFGVTERDKEWFTSGQMAELTKLCMIPPETDPTITSRRDGWVSGLIAVERYREWLLAKTNKIENKL
jgi:hypothetical protein